MHAPRSAAQENCQTLEIKYRAFEVPDVFVVGYGLDYLGRYRELPALYATRNLARMTGRCFPQSFRSCWHSAAASALRPLPASALELRSIEQAAADYRSPNSHLEEMFRSALLETSRLAQYAPDSTAYIMTGDIPAEWLRDASAQARPYLFFAKDDPDVRALLRAIIARMVKYLQIDPYANAYTLDYRVWEQKFELDSLAYPTALAWSYWKTTGDASIFTKDFSTMLDDVLATMEREQNHPRDSRYAHKELPNGGRGNPVGYTGMIWTGFRPSDDACEYNYLIPSEMFAVVALGDMAEIELNVYHNLIKAREAKALRDEVQRGIQTYGLVLVPKYGYIYAYEVDGLGHAILTDDANIPEPPRGAVLRLHERRTIATTTTRGTSCSRRIIRRSIRDIWREESAVITRPITGFGPWRSSLKA